MTEKMTLVPAALIEQIREHTRYCDSLVSQDNADYDTEAHSADLLDKVAACDTEAVQQIPDYDEDAALILGHDDITDRECTLIELGMAISRAQAETGDAAPDADKVAERFMDPEDLDAAREFYTQCTGDDSAGTWPRSQLSLWYARSKADRRFRDDTTW